MIAAPSTPDGARERVRHHVIIGTGIAALSAAEAIRDVDDRARITMIGDEDAGFYSRPALAYRLTGELPAERLLIRTDAQIELLRLERRVARVNALLPEAHKLQLTDGHTLTYDTLLLATGAASTAPDFAGGSLDGVMRLDGLSDTEALIARARTAKAAVVVGGGSTALELVDGLHARGVPTHYLLRGERYWSKVFDRVESAIVESRLTARGVTLHRNTSIREALGVNGRLVGVRTNEGRTIPADLLAVAIGVRPRTELARQAGLVVERGIRTNERLETSHDGIYAAGDCAQVYDPITRTAQLDTLWSSALAQGRTAGYNMAGLGLVLRQHPPLNVTRVAGVTTTIIGAVGGAADPDLLTLTRGQSERWQLDPDAWSVGGTRHEDRLRVVVSGQRIVGAVVMGDQRVSVPLAHLIGEQVDISALRPLLDAAPDDALDRLLAFCESHVHDPDGHRVTDPRSGR
ncbi:MAG: FAD-dependent oxidoreductase [Gemmatimonadaceae bacterium]|nr:FAD-dependent oxidoreductase [Gemmatimonadaceae bacterium]